MSISKKNTYEEFRKDSTGLETGPTKVQNKKNGNSKQATNESAALLEVYRQENEDLKKKLKGSHIARNNLYFLPMPMFSIDRDFTITYMNRKAAESIKAEPKDCVGKKCYSLFRTAHCNTPECRGKWAMERDGIFSGETVSGQICLGYTASPIKDSNGMITGVMEMMEDITSQKKVVLEITRLSSEAKKGNLSARIDIDIADEEFKPMVKAFNETLDAVINPLNVAADYFDKISAGTIPAKITDTYYGDFNKIKDNLNRCIDGLGGLAESNHVLQRMALNDTTKKVEGNYHGIYAEVAQASNEVRERLLRIQETTENIARGDFRNLEEYHRVGKRCENDHIVPAFTQLMENIQHMTKDAEILSKAALEGKLETRADASKHQGEYRKVVEGVNQTLDSVIGPLNVAAHYVDRISKGDIPERITDKYNGDFNEIKDNLNKCIDALNGLTEEMTRMSAEHNKGDIDVMINTERFQGSYKNMAAGINEMVSGHIAVKKKAMACVQELGRGNFDAQLERFPGKKVFINETIEQLRANLKGLIEDMNKMSDEHNKGDIDVYIDGNKYHGEFKSMAMGVNEMVSGHIAVKKKAMACVAEFGRGNFEAPLERFPGKKAFINETIEQVRVNLKALIADADMLSKAAVEGKLETRADASKHHGDFRKIVQGVNDTLDAVIGPLNVAADYVDRISKGDIPERITDKYNGDFNEIKINLNKCIDAVNLLVADANMLSQAAVEGKLATRADASKHQGDYAKIVSGVNATLDSVVSPINEAMRISEAYSKGDLTARVQIKTSGDFSKFAQYLDNTGTGLTKTVMDISEQVTDLTKSAEEATASAEEVISASKTVAVGASNIGTSTEKGAEGIKQVLKAMEDLAAAVAEVSSNAEVTSNLALKADEQSKKGAELAGRAGGSMVQVTKASQEVAGIITDIKSQMEQIGKIVQLIQNIANQTNLLALNAAIEAARAGDAGRGFAVVATEVKALAQNSQASAENISEMIGALQKKSENAVVAMETATKEVTKGTEQVDDALKAFKEIVTAVGDITNNIQQVAAATEEQSASVEEITASVTEVHSLIESVSREAQASAAATQQVNASMEEIGSIIETVNKISQGVASEMNKFKVAG